MLDNKRKNLKSNIIVKAGLWYTICNFLFRGFSFITTPIFARLLTKNEMGAFSNFSAWVSILTVLTSFDFAQSIIRSKLEHKDDMDSYIWSILFLSTIWTLFVYGMVYIFSDYFIKLLQIEKKHIHILFLYLLTTPAYLMLVTKHRTFYKYKLFVAITGCMTVTGILFSLVMVFLMSDHLDGRILGLYIPQIVIGMVIYCYLFVKGKRIKVKYWKYVCSICFPIVPHVLSLYMLSSSDKIIITRLCGGEYTALYSIAYSVYHIVTILFDSMNKAWAPWLLDSLHQKRYQEIKRNSRVYIAVFLLIIVGILLFVPELIFVLGGKQYIRAVYCLPPLIASCVFQFLYTMYVNVEFYMKKTFGVSIATIAATIINIILNFIFIPMCPEKSYIIAAYTTLVGYFMLFVFHYFAIKYMKMDQVYDIKYILRMLLLTIIISGIMNMLYGMWIIRYFIICIYVIAVLLLGFRFKRIILSIFRKDDY